MCLVRKGLQNLKQYSLKENDQTVKKKAKFTCVFEFVIALIYWGFPEILGQEFLTLVGGHTPSYYQIQNAFDIIRPILKRLAEKCIAKDREDMPANSSVCVDGSWGPSMRCQNAYI